MQVPQELDKKVRLSLSTLVAIITLTFTVSGVVVKVLDNDNQREQLKEYLIEEINGLRSDWERQYDQDLNKRLDRLEKKVENLK